MNNKIYLLKRIFKDLELLNAHPIIFTIMIFKQSKEFEIFVSEWHKKNIFMPVLELRFLNKIDKYEQLVSRLLGFFIEQEEEVFYEIKRDTRYIEVLLKREAYKQDSVSYLNVIKGLFYYYSKMIRSKRDLSETEASWNNPFHTSLVKTGNYP